MTTRLVDILIGATGSILAVIVIWFFARGKQTVSLLSSSRQTAVKLREGGITAFRLSRQDYSERLPTFLSQANHSITIVSISLKLTSDEGEIVELLRNRIVARKDFRVAISLLNPESPALAAASASLNMTEAQLKSEIRDMLDKLKKIKESLSKQERQRLRVLVHNALPMGSAILLDATQDRGLIQVETKLYRAPRTDSFGYEVVGQSSFYSHNYTAWMHVVDDSTEVKEEDL